MRKIALILLLNVILCLACKQSTKNERSINQPSRPISELALDVIHKGDTNAYYELSNAYLDYGHETFLPYALIMANKYNYGQAYYDVFDCLWELYGNIAEDLMLLDSLDSTTRDIALTYLQKAVDRGYGESVLGEYYLHGKYFPQDTILGNKLIRKSNK